jgi:hypothetical protein
MTHYHSGLHERPRGTGWASALLVLAFGCTETGNASPDGQGAASTGGGASGDGAAAGTGGGTSLDDAALSDFSRLTRAEYSATVLAALGVVADIKLIPEDGRIGPFTSNVGVTPDPVHPYLLLAEELALAVVPAVLPACEAGNIQTCLEEDFRAPLEHLFRRPLSPSELSTWAAVGQEVEAAGGDATLATRAMLGAALISPDFLYRSSPANGGENAWARRVGEWIAYVLWDAPPDEQLRAATEATTALGPNLRDEAARLALDARAAPILARFFAQWLDVDTDLRKDEDDAFESSPDYLELVAFVEEALQSGAPLADFVGGAWGVVHPDNADVYGRSDSGGENVERVEWPSDSLRRGLLGQELMAGSTRHPDAGRRPIFRGLLVRRALLCDQIPLPAPGLVALAGEVEDRTVDERCAPCHQHIDPIGYAFAALDPDFEGVPPEATVLDHPELAGTYEDVADLLEAVAASRTFASCFAQKWLAFFLEQEPSEVSSSFVSSLADAVEAGASLATIVEQTALELADRSERAIPWCEGE